MIKRSAVPKKIGKRFDPVNFLKTAAKGRAISTHRKKQIIFAQGDVADAVFYIQEGKVKVTIVSNKGKEVKHILARNARVEEDLVDQLFNSTEKRLARVLLLLANFGNKGHPEPIKSKISQEMLAEMIGTTRSRVSQFMNKFRDLGYIDYNGHLEVHNSLLRVFLDDPPNTVRAASP